MTATASPQGFSSLSVPTYRGSTIVFPDVESFEARGTLGKNGYSYGLAGTPTSRTLAAKLNELEGGAETFLVPSGLMAITVTMLALLSPGQTVLLPETVYAPVRRFATETLKRMSIRTVYYDPTLPEGIDFSLEGLRLIWVESPGSLTMEVQNIEDLSRRAHAKGVLLGCDNSWASPLLCRPLDLGADIVVEAVTKYLSGHSDLLMGSITAGTQDLAALIHATVRSLGVGVSPDDCFLALRGMETAALRLSHVGRVALDLAQRLEERSDVEQVLHPGLPTFPGHALWSRQAVGTSGVFSFLLRDGPRTLAWQALSHFQIGASWGGTHSLIAPSKIADGRGQGRYDGKVLLRVSTGLEPVEQLANDLAKLLN